MGKKEATPIKDPATPIEVQRLGERAIFEYNERAAVYEYHGGMNRKEAERRALEYVRGRYGDCQRRLI